MTASTNDPRAQADTVLMELDPDAADFEARFYGATEELQHKAYTLWVLSGLPAAESELWGAVYSRLFLIREKAGYTAYVEDVRSCLRALRTLRDCKRLDHALTQQAVELSRLRRVLESSASVDQLRALVRRWRSAAGRVDGGSSDERWARSIALGECAVELQQALEVRPDEPVPGPSDQTQPVPVINTERPHPMADGRRVGAGPVRFPPHRRREDEMMGEHVETLRRMQMYARGAIDWEAYDALTAAIKALEARDAAPNRMSTKELRDACEKAARDLWGKRSYTHCREISRVHNWWLASAGEVLDGDADDNELVRLHECVGERDAWEQLLAALRVRLVQRGDR